MSEAPAKKPAAPPPPNPEAEATARVNALQDTVKALEIEVRILQGKTANRDPRAFKELARENTALQERVVRLQKALYGLLSESSQPRTNEDYKNRVEILRRSALDYCKKLNVNPELWKSIES